MCRDKLMDSRNFRWIRESVSLIAYYTSMCVCWWIHQPWSENISKLIPKSNNHLQLAIETEKKMKEKGEGKQFNSIHLLGLLKHPCCFNRNWIWSEFFFFTIIIMRWNDVMTIDEHVKRKRNAMNMNDSICHSVYTALNIRE